MAKPKRNKVREHRIDMEIVVDAYDDGERAMGWYYYLEERLVFPFAATCIAKREISPLAAKDEVEVLRMAGEDECSHDMFVTIRWGKSRKGEGGLAVPLMQLKPSASADDATQEAVEDWHYWVAMGYGF